MIALRKTMDWFETPDAGQLGVAGHHCLRDHQRRPDRHQRQQHRDRAAVDQQQHGEDQDGDRDLDGQAILLAGDGEVRDGGRRTGDVDGEWAARLATLCSTMSATRLNESKARGVPNSPARPTGNTQVVLSSLVRNGRSCGVLTKSCTDTTSVTSSRSASTSLR